MSNKEDEILDQCNSQFDKDDGSKSAEIIKLTEFATTSPGDVVSIATSTNSTEDDISVKSIGLSGGIGGKLVIQAESSDSECG